MHILFIYTIICTGGFEGLTGIFRFSSDPLPASSDPLPASLDPFPATSDPFPATSDPFPTSLDPLPAGSAPLPASSGSHPASSDPLPANSDSLPASSDPHPASSDPLPASSDPLPASSHPLPASISSEPVAATCTLPRESDDARRCSCPWSIVSKPVRKKLSRQGAHGPEEHLCPGLRTNYSASEMGLNWRSNVRELLGRPVPASSEPVAAASTLSNVTVYIYIYMIHF